MVSAESIKLRPHRLGGNCASNGRELGMGDSGVNGPRAILQASTSAAGAWDTEMR